jgi:AraC-like DNA-binding protein
MPRSVHFTTRHLSRTDQFDAWRSYNAAVVDLDCDDRRSGFCAEHTSWDLGSLVFTQATMPPMSRNWRHVRKQSVDHWCLVLAAAEDSNGVTNPAATAQLTFRSLARPFEGAGTDGKVLTLFMPRDLFGDVAPALDGAADNAPGGALAALLADFLIALDRRLPSARPEDLPGMVAAVRGIVTACLAPSPATVEAARHPLDACLLDRARTIVRANLDSPSFNPRLLGRALGVSRSSLYRMFDPIGGVAAYIQRERLHEAHARLCDPGDPRSIVRIARSVGMLDASGFSRAFKRLFGYSPREARAIVHGGRRPMPEQGRADRSEPAAMGDMLHWLEAR